MAKIFEPALLASSLIDVVEGLIKQKSGLASTKPAESALKDIAEYEGRMRVSGMDKFNAPSFIAVSNLYLNEAEKQKKKVRGALVVFMNAEVADKLFKGLGYVVPYDEDDDSMMKLCGQFTESVVDGFKERLTSSGYAPLIAGAPLVYKNTVAEGVAFSADQNEKQEINFNYFKHKAITVEATLAPIPTK